MLTHTQAQSFAKYYNSKCIENMSIVDIDIALADWILLQRKVKRNNK